MGKVICGMTFSLDGFVSDPHGDVSRLYPDLGALAQSEMLQEEMRTTGAVILGRRTYDMAEDPDLYAGNYEFQVPLFVLTHRVPQKKPKESGSLTITFVTDGIERAVAQAKAAAGERNVVLIGASVSQQCINAGLCDELHIGFMPVLLGGGLRFFDNIDPNRFTFERFRLIDSGPRTDLWYHVVPGPTG